MYNNAILDDWINAIDAYIYYNINNDINSRLKINILDKNYFNKLLSDIPEFYNGKLIKEKVKSYGELGFLSSIAYYLVFNMSEDTTKGNIYKKFINLFTDNGNVNYNDLINYLSKHKDILGSIFNEIVNIERKKIINKKTTDNYNIDGYIKLTDSIEVLKLTAQTHNLLMRSGIHTILELLYCDDLSNIKNIKAKNLDEIKDKLKLIDIKKRCDNHSELKKILLIEKENLKNKIDELIDKDPNSAYLFLIGANKKCDEYLNNNDNVKGCNYKKK